MYRNKCAITLQFSKTVYQITDNTLNQKNLDQIQISMQRYRFLYITKIVDGNKNKRWLKSHILIFQEILLIYNTKTKMYICDTSVIVI